MSEPVSIHLDDQVRASLEAAALERGVDLPTYLHDLAVTEARRLQRERIRKQSRQVAAHIAGNADARAFAEDWAPPPRHTRA